MKQLSALQSKFFIILLFHYFIILLFLMILLFHYFIISLFCHFIILSILNLVKSCIFYDVIFLFEFSVLFVSVRYCTHIFHFSTFILHLSFFSFSPWLTTQYFQSDGFYLKITFPNIHFFFFAFVFDNL